MTDIQVPLFQDPAQVPLRLGTLLRVDLENHEDRSIGMCASYRFSNDEDAYPEEFAFLMDRSRKGRPLAALIKADTYVYNPFSSSHAPKDPIDAEAAFNAALAEPVAIAQSGAYEDFAITRVAPLEIPEIARRWHWAAMRYRQTEGPDTSYGGLRVSHLAVRLDAGYVTKVRYTYPSRYSPQLGYSGFLMFLLEWHRAVEGAVAGRTGQVIGDLGAKTWPQAISELREATSAPPILLDPDLLQPGEALMPPPVVLAVSPSIDAFADTQSPEIAYLGNGHALTLTGMQLPNARLMEVLNDGDTLKSLLLMFDSLLVLGLAPSPEQDSNSPSVSLLSPRPLKLGPAELYADLSYPVDDITYQLIETGSLQCVDPRAIAGEQDVLELLERFIDAGCEMAGHAPPADETRVPLDPGPLGPLMSEELVQWTFEELRHLGLCERKDTEFISITDKAGQSHSSGSSVVLVSPHVASIFRLLVDQSIRKLGSNAGLALSPIQIGDDSLAGANLLSNAGSLDWGELALLEMRAADIDLSHANFADVLEFRRENDLPRRHLIRQLREQVAALNSMAGAAADNDVADILAEVRENSREVEGALRNAFGRGAATLVLGAAGIAANATSGNAVGAGASLLQMFDSLQRADSGPSVFTYLFRARSRLT
jgi:hypothetical protein